MAAPTPVSLGRRNGSTNASHDKIQQAIDALTKKIQDLQTDFDKSQSQEQSINKQVADNEQSLREIEQHSFVQMPDGTVIHTPYPQAYYTLKSQNNDLRNQLSDLTTHIDTLRSTARDTRALYPGAKLQRRVKADRRRRRADRRPRSKRTRRHRNRRRAPAPMPADRAFFRPDHPNRPGEWRVNKLKLDFLRVANGRSRTLDQTWASSRSTSISSISWRHDSSSPIRASERSDFEDDLQRVAQVPATVGDARALCDRAGHFFDPSHERAVVGRLDDGVVRLLHTRIVRARQSRRQEKSRNEFARGLT